MMYISHMKRIIKNKVKLISIIILLLIPTLEVVQLLYQFQDIELTRSIYKLFFLSGAGRGHLFQIIYLWILPLYLLFLIGDDSCYDEKTKYKYTLLSRIGKKKYIKEKWIITFCFSFLLMLISLFINMLFVYIVFHSRCNDIYFKEEIVGATGILGIMFLNHPLISYMLYMFIASLISGLIGMMGSVLSTVFRDKKYVYSITFMIWLVFIVYDESIMLVLQPYIEYPLEILMTIFLRFIFVCFMVILGAILYEKKRVCE